MDTFSPVHQPDEGYSEDPLNPSTDHSLLASLSTLRSPSELPAWLVNNASNLPTAVKKELTNALLDDLPTSVVADIVNRLSPRLYIDFVRHLPTEICLKILGFLDAVSLVCVLQTCRTWYDLGLDRKLWERLYHMEGWKAIYPEIQASEDRINESLDASLGQLRRAPSPEGHANKIRAILNEDEDLEMTDSNSSALNQSFGGNSIFGSPTSSFSSSRKAITPVGEFDLSFSSKGKSVDRNVSMTDGSAKRKAPSASPELSFAAPVTIEAKSSFRSTLWSWDPSSSKYRLNWKYLYNMRRRLESNWELAKFSTFMLPHPQHPQEGHNECIYTIQFDGDFLVSGSRDRTMRIWNTKTRRLVRPPLIGHHGSVLCLQFDADPEEDILVSGSSDSNVHIWKFSTGQIIQSLTRAHRESVLNVRFDKNILVTSSKDKTIKIFNRRTLNPGDMGFPGNGEVVQPVGRSVRQYGYEPDLDHELAIKPYTLIGRLDGHGAAVNAIQVRGRNVVSVSGDRQIKMWDWPKQVCTKTIPAHDKGIACVEYDERRIVSGSSDFEVCIFDAVTGLKVAALRGHANLVRTVQAGFGDLPYSTSEDEKEARRVDEEYLKAIGSSQDVPPEMDKTSQRSRPVNAGSSRPADMQAFGAKIPPGGGGSRKYGRIVSGSYDQSIIVWRRDKEGVWKPAHHLRQEEAADRARQASIRSRDEIATDTNETALPIHPALPATAGESSTAETIRSMQVPLLGGSDGRIENTPQAAGLFIALIDQVVPRGVVALQQALASYPSLLVHHTYLQSAIERDPSPFIRQQLRQAVTSALVNIQMAQSARQQLQDAAGMAMDLNGPSSSAAATAGHSTASEESSATPTARRSGSRSTTAAAPPPRMQPMALPQQIHPFAAAHHLHRNPSVAATMTDSAASSSAAANSGPPTNQTPAPTPATLTPVPAAAIPVPQVPVQVPTVPAADHPAAPVAQAAPAATETAEAETAEAEAPGADDRHPHMAPAESMPARVFKLQFDAHKIVCCTQAHIIVGWDFCNNDPELEEVSRFFATVD